MSHPCLRCGACCAFYRVAFHWSEAESFLGGEVPPALTVKLDPHRLAMCGTDLRKPRCVALQGEVGRSVSCAIYVQRPSVCRELMPSWSQGESISQCDRARQAHGLRPLQPCDWLEMGEPDAEALPDMA
jgi:uncharacterized protein